MKKRDIIVIGGSTGSLSVLKELVKALPKDLPAAVFIVWHMAANSPGILPELLKRTGNLPAENARDNQKIETRDASTSHRPIITYCSKTIL